MHRWGGLGVAWVIPLILAVLLSPSAAAWEIDTTDTVSRVIDGDTFDTPIEGRVRLADIDTPERGEPGADEATDYLKSLILNEEVHLDIDDIYETGPYGRLISVVYVRHDATRLLNVNKALLNEGHAEITDFPNEFDPYTWTLYVSLPEEPPSPAEPPPAAEQGLVVSPTAVLVPVVLVTILIFGLALTYVLLRKRR